MSALSSGSKRPMTTPVGRWAGVRDCTSSSPSFTWSPENTNMIADALSRLAYPASQAARDVTKHGTVEEKEEMKRLIQEEEAEERYCLVTTRSGKDTAEVQEEEISKKKREETKSRSPCPHPLWPFRWGPKFHRRLRSVFHVSNEPRRHGLDFSSNQTLHKIHLRFSFALQLRTLSPKSNPSQVVVQKSSLYPKFLN